MPRNPGATIDTDRRAVLDRDGVWHPLDELHVAGNTLYYARPLEFPGITFDYHRRWVLLDQQWSISQLRFFPGAENAIDWYIEPDNIEREGALWSVRDAFLDVLVHEGVRYEVEDAGELAEALRDGAIAVDDATRALMAFDALVEELRRNGCSGAKLLGDFAPALPQAEALRR